MSDSLAQHLFDGPLDIVGDVHGEIAALTSLMHHLGYDNDGRHPDHRRLVFVGDLTDRGPDSPAVVDLVNSLVAAGRAQCVLGNHDLNILLDQEKHDNHWFFGEKWSLDASDEPTPAVFADENVRQTVTTFFKSLPVALERDDLRVVHACWDDEMVDLVRNATDVVALHDQYADEFRARHGTDKLGKQDPERLEKQNGNPVKVLTSGKERHTDKPHVASGKLRYEERVHWWEQSASGPFCVFGHYSLSKENRKPFSGAFCVDFAVAGRWKERQEKDFNGNFTGRLAALRWPEREIVFDNGDREELSFAPVSAS
jgi:hypothetical protein